MPTPLTRNSRETMQARVPLDPAFREELLKEGVERLLPGEAETGEALLRAAPAGARALGAAL